MLVPPIINWKDYPTCQETIQLLTDENYAGYSCLYPELMATTQMDHSLRVVARDRADHLSF
jgi:hypothetical protein